MKQQLFELKSRMAARRRSNSSSTFERRASKLWFPFLSPEFHSTKCRSLRVTEENSPFCSPQCRSRRGGSLIWTRRNRIWRRDISWGIAFGFGLRRVFPAEMILNFLRCRAYEILLIRASPIASRAYPQAKATFLRIGFSKIHGASHRGDIGLWEPCPVHSCFRLDSG